VEPYPEQLAAGLTLHDGVVVEMATGEGKTLAAVAPTAAAALEGRGAHVLTHNDYLAARDAAWMGPAYRLLGLEVGCVQEGMDPSERRRSHAADVTYLTLREVGFDLLRDGLALDLGEQALRPLHWALVDELTGRVAELRQWPDGLQAAVEASEGLRPADEGIVLGSITVQHLLRLYPRLCGMTGTAQPAAEELRSFYGLEVVSIPTHRPCIREDLEDLVFPDQGTKWRAVEEEVVSAHCSGRPVLVGTGNVAESERLAATLARRGVPSRVLNARQDAAEAAVVAAAGAPRAVTVSTNMAGRGTDIRLGGEDERERERVVALGGLYVIGTVRHRSRRIDQQLRGRAGRQGDPGASRFVVALDDELPRRCGLDRLLPRGWVPGTGPVRSPVVRQELNRVQRIAEGEELDIRRRLWRYSEVLESQRQLVQGWRQEVLEDPRAATELAERLPAEVARLISGLGREPARRVAQQLTLRAIDRCWSEHLAEMRGLRDEIHLVQLDGRDPVTEFCRSAVRSFDDLEERVAATVAAAFERLRVGPDGVDWEQAGLERPSATWTYLVNDQVWGDNLLRNLANHTAWKLGAFLLSPLLLAWGFYLRWQRRRASAR